VVDGLGADHLAAGPVEVGRGEHERERLRATHPAVRADQLLEGGDLGRVVPDPAVDDDVGTVREVVGAEDMAGRVRAERVHRIFRGWLAELGQDAYEEDAYASGVDSPGESTRAST